MVAVDTTIPTVPPISPQSAPADAQKSADAESKDAFEAPEVAARRKQLDHQMGMLKAQEEFAKEESKMQQMQAELHRARELREMQANLERERHQSMMSILAKF